jgi:hypothetical protein
MQENKIIEENVEINVENEEVVEEKKKKGIKRTIAIVLALILLLLGMRSCSRQEELQNTNISAYVMGDGFSPGLSNEEIQELIQKKIDASKMSFSVYTKPIFKGKKGTIMFGNPINSAHNLELEVTLDGKTIIKTEKMPPNKYIEKIEMLKKLPKGKHKADARIRAYDRKTDAQVGEVAIDMLITVK